MTGFPNRIAFVATQDGRNVKFLKDIRYIAQDGRVFVIPEGATSDGASTPAEIWPFLPPNGRDYWLAACLHDCGYKNTLLMEVQGENGVQLVKANLSRETCDLLIKEAMESLGVDSGTIEKIYLGVSTCGWLAYKQDRS